MLARSASGRRSRNPFAEIRVLRHVPTKATLTLHLPAIAGARKGQILLSAHTRQRRTERILNFCKKDERRLTLPQNGLHYMMVSQRFGSGN